ncbi:MAG: amidase family protein, partial [Nakamurella sp.]
MADHTQLVDWRSEFTATAISAAVRAGECSAGDAVAESLRRIADRDAAVGAFVIVRHQAAMAEARALQLRPDLASLPLAGVPIAIKDNIAVAGEPLRNGSAATSSSPAIHDHPVVARLRQAGAIIVGITAVPELCIWGSTDSPWSVTRNPWDRSRSPGGSSGGSAAAVASGMVPIAHAADGLGSIRVPAASCGLFGIKPGLGLVPAQLGPHSWYGMAENGPLATTVGDAALMLSVMAAEPGLAAPRPAGRLRIAIAVGSPLAFLRTDRYWVGATQRIGRLLAELGHTVTPIRLSYAVIAPISRWLAGPAVDAVGLDHSLLQSRTRSHLAVGGLARHLVRDGQIPPIDRRAQQLFEHFDVVLTPALAHPPPLLGIRSNQSWIRNVLADSRFAPYSAQWNVLGYPAASVPAGRHPVSRTP